MSSNISGKKEKISIICPVFNEEQTIPLFYNRLMNVFKNLSGYDYELIFTNNRSTDRSYVLIQEIQKKDPHVHVLTFSRNFGYQASVLAGLTHATGDAMVIIDVDCEDPPELIPEFVKKWQEGNQIAYGIRGKRDESGIITWFRFLFYRILKFTADTDIILDMAEFSLMTKHVRDTIIKNTNTFPFLRAEIAYSGFKKTGIPYDRQPRIAGKTGYNLWRMAVFAWAGILSVSTFPLRLSFYSMPFVILINIIGMILDYQGHDTFKTLVIFDFIFAMIAIAFQGLYVARIYKNGIGRSVFIVDWEFSDSRLNNTKPAEPARAL